MSRLNLIMVAAVLSACISTRPTPEQKPSDVGQKFTTMLSNPFTSSLPKRSQSTVIRIAVGSCNNQDKDQDYWSTILAYQPDLWIWAGDNVYADTDDRDEMRAIYQQQLDSKPYQHLLKSVPIIGTWDDHDYGLNNGGQEFSQRVMSQQFFLDFIGEPADSPRRQQQGIYTSYVLGSGQRSIKIILLDARYHRDRPGKDADILGEEQWNWLQKTLEQNPTRLTMIVSGIQILPVDHPFEKWQDFPVSRTRLLNLLQQHPEARTILISGDRHLAEFSQIPQDAVGLAYDLTEVTSSGLTHSYTKFKQEYNRYRVGEVMANRNYATITIDWQEPAQATLDIRNMQGKSVESLNVAL